MYPRWTLAAALPPHDIEMWACWWRGAEGSVGEHGGKLDRRQAFSLE